MSARKEGRKGGREKEWKRRKRIGEEDIKVKMASEFGNGRILPKVGPRGPESGIPRS